MKKDLILLHGALGTKAQLQPLANLLSDQFNVHRLNFEGHGDRTLNSKFEIATFSENLSQYIKENNLAQPDVFGYSMGGYIALYLEATEPNSLGKIITLGTKFDWTPESSAQEVRMLNPQKIEEKVPKFASQLEQLHAPNDWKVNMRNTAEMMVEMGENPPLNPELLSKISNDVYLHVGEKDMMVTQAETKVIQNQLKNATFSVIKDCEHPIDRVDPLKIKTTIIPLL